MLPSAALCGGDGGEERAIGRASLWLEEAIYAEDFLRDKERARGLLEQVHENRAEALPPVWAEATYRLARLLRESGQIPDARRKAVALRDAVPGLRDPSWAVRVDTLLEENTRLTAAAAPWPEGEYLVYTVDSPGGGEEFGYAIEWTGTAELDGQPVVDHRSWLYVQLTNLISAVRVRAQPVEEGYRPLLATGRNHLSDNYRAEFDPAARELRFRFGDTNRTTELPAGNLYLDNEQFIHITRILDPQTTPLLAFHTILPGGMLAEAEQRFEGMETISVAGREVEAEVWQGQLRDPAYSTHRTTTWVDPAPPRHVLRFEQGNVVINLRSVMVRPDMEPLDETLAQFNYNYRIPRGWVAHATAKPIGGQTHQVHFISPCGLGYAVWLVSNVRSGEISLDEVVETDQSRLASIIPDYRADEGSLHAGEHHGRPSRAYSARFIDRNQPHFEKRTYWVEGDRVHWLVFRAPETLRGELDTAAREILRHIRPAAQ
ncbi:MAG: hypothetical protein JJU00_17540 [Opitutales bacterium]|nr:hypothetical protein [Opitutales bacterium]